MNRSFGPFFRITTGNETFRLVFHNENAIRMQRFILAHSSTGADPALEFGEGHMEGTWGSGGVNCILTLFET